MSVWAVLVAAGRGERLGEDRPKAFARLGELPLLAEPLRRLDDCDWIDGIVVVAPADWEEPAILLAEELGASKVTACVTGGSTRSGSVRIGLAEVPESAAAVLVHDAARPFLPPEIVPRLLDALGAGFDGAVPGLPVADTVKRARDGLVLETLPRDELVAVQTPQAFVAAVLRRAAAGEGSDCASLVEAVGGRVAVVPGDERLLKVTTAADLRRVEAWLAAERAG
jgi:2-C-methyl-D-erythritol 4-phosphate cytidylyltransferase